MELAFLRQTRLCLHSISVITTSYYPSKLSLIFTLTLVLVTFFPSVYEGTRESETSMKRKKSGEERTWARELIRESGETN